MVVKSAQSEMVIYPNEYTHFYTFEDPREQGPADLFCCRAVIVLVSLEWAAGYPRCGLCQVLAGREPVAAFS